MPNTSFTLEQQLPSLRVNKELLEALETYLVEYFQNSDLLSSGDCSKAISIEIEDGRGTEKLDSIKSMVSSRFADSTSRVYVSAELPILLNKARALIRIRLTKDRLSSTFNIQATTQNSREFALGMREGILRVIEPHRTWHWLVHPTPTIWGFVVSVAVAILVGMWNVPDTHLLHPNLQVLFLIVCLYIFLTPHLRPYTSFDSRLADRLDKFWSWFLWGLATFLLFGTFFTYFRRSLLGF